METSYVKFAQVLVILVMYMYTRRWPTHRAHTFLPCHVTICIQKDAHCPGWICLYFRGSRRAGKIQPRYFPPRREISEKGISPLLLQGPLLRDRIINSHFASKLNSFNMGGRGNGRFKDSGERADKCPHFPFGASCVACSVRATKPTRRLFAIEVPGRGEL